MLFITSLALYMHIGIDFYLNINYKFSEKLALRIFVSRSMLDGKKGEVGQPMTACQVKSWSIKCYKIQDICKYFRN